MSDKVLRAAGKVYRETVELKKRIKELEEELEQCLDCCKRVGELEAERDKLHLLLVLLYNQGYLAGHHDTVESQYSHILSEDMYSFHADVVAEILEELE